MHRLPQEDQQQFWEKALYAMPTWKSTIPITFKYLQRLQKPVARVNAKVDHGKTNHATKDIKLPRQNALAVGAIVMLLVNFVVEQGLFNGAIGVVIDICYKENEGPRVKGSLPAYVVVAFPGVRFTPGTEWDLENPTHVPIPLVTLRCENKSKCCSVTTIPLRVSKAITIYKSQGLTVGLGQVWELLVIMLPSIKGRPVTPGLEQTAFSRAKTLDCLAILTDPGSPLTYERLQKIGKSPSFDKRRAFENRLKELQGVCVPALKKQVEAFDTTSPDKTFEGGFLALMQWYRNYVNQALQAP
jgi:hypothetical protein